MMMLCMLCMLAGTASVAVAQPVRSHVGDTNPTTEGWTESQLGQLATA